MIKNGCQEFSEEKGKEILKAMKGVNFCRSYRSKINDDDSSDSDSNSDSDSDSDSDSNCDDFESKFEYGFGCYTKDDDIDTYDHDDVRKIHKNELLDAIRPFYEGERFLIQNEAHPRDVYFKHPNHPGTQAFVRASQQLVCRMGAERKYDVRTYFAMKKLLYDSKYFVGKAPRCMEANREERDRIFQARYEFDRKMMQKIIRENRIPRPIPGTQWCKCCNKKYDENKKHWTMKLFACFPKTLAIPILVFIALIGFGLLYFLIWYLFKVLITTIYVVMGVSISYLIGNGDDEEPLLTEGEAVKEAVDEYIEETIGEVSDIVERSLRNLRA